MSMREEKKAEIGEPFYKGQSDLKAILYGEIDVNNEKYSAADICLVCDITGSMKGHIDLIKEMLKDFMKTIHTLIGTKPRIAVIGFRDKKDKKPIEKIDFTNKRKDIVEFLGGLDVTGGDDDCEDLVAPLMELLNLDWRSDLKYVYLLLDAPTHGSRYHDDTDSDDYPDDDKEGLLEKLCFHLMKCTMNLVILKCNESVNIMTEIMRKYYDTERNKLTIIDMPHTDLVKKDFAKNFLVTVTKDITQSIMSSRYRNFRRVKQRRYESKVVDEEAKESKTSTFNGVIHTGSIDNLSFKDKAYNYSIKLSKGEIYEFEVSEKYIGSGMFSDCYYLAVNGEEKRYVGKFPKFIVERLDELKLDIETSLLTKYFADKFNVFLRKAETKAKPGKAPAIRVLSLSIIEKLTPIGHKDKFFLAQRYLPGAYIKFNNNYGWVNKEVKDYSNFLAQAFSHFTYEYSMGTMLVSDIQGTVERGKGKEEEKEEEKEVLGLLLTDPAIHSLIYKDRFGETNHGKVGIIRFFQTHNCNDYCEKLSLSDPRKVDTSKLKEIRAKFESEKGLNHLNQNLESLIENMNKKIKDFRKEIEPNISIYDAGPEPDENSTVYL